MKNLLFVLLCLGISFSSSAQDKPKFVIKSAMIHYESLSSLEGGGSCDARFTPVVNGKPLPSDVIGYNGFMSGGGKHWIDFDKASASLGKLDIGQKHTLAFKIWENDCGEAWDFDSSCGFLNGDDDHGTTPTITIDPEDFKKPKGEHQNFTAEYTITKKSKGDGKGKDNAGYEIKLTLIYQ